MQVLPVSSSKGLSGLSFQTRTIGNKIPNEEYAGAVLSAINDSDWLTVVGGVMMQSPGRFMLRTLSLLRLKRILQY